MSDPVQDFDKRLVAFFREHYDSFIRRFGNRWNRTDVEDAIDQSFLEFYKRVVVKKQPEPENWTAFLNTVIRHKLIDISRKRWREVSIDDGSGMGKEDGDNALGERPIANIPDEEQVPADEAFAWKMTLHALFDCLPQQSVDLTKRWMKGQTVKEIGEVYGHNGYRLWHTVRKHVCGCLQKMIQAGDPNAEALSLRFCTGRA